MSKITFSFLLVHSVFQDTISYEINEPFTFEDVILHICNSFGFTRHQVSITSNMGIEIENIDSSVYDIADQYGDHFKLIVMEQTQSLEAIIANQMTSFSTAENLIEEAKVNNLDEWSKVGPQISAKKFKSNTPEVSPSKSTEMSKPADVIDPVLEEQSIREAFYDAVDNLYFLSSNTIAIDENGMAELVILPRLNTYITQLRIKFDIDKPAKSLFTKIAFTCGYLPRELMVIPVQKEAGSIDDLDITIEELLEQYGSAYLVYHENMRDELSSGTSIQEQINELITKYTK